MDNFRPLLSRQARGSEANMERESPAPAVRGSDHSSRTSISFLQHLLGDYRPRDFAVRLWDGSVWEAEPGRPARFTLVIRRPGALRRMFWPPTELAFGEAYIHNDFDIEGEVEVVARLAEYLFNRSRSLAEKLKIGLQFFSLPSDRRARDGRQAVRLGGASHSKERGHQAVTDHYDIPNDFFALWLGESMIYSCAYFATPDEDLDQAQERKLDYICRKLRLRRNERLLDIGCGWGGLIVHAARNYGVQAHGITLSQPQADLANERIRQAGLDNRCRIEVRDYRDLNEPGFYNKLVSIGMFEHVSEAMLSAYFKQAWRLLRPGGVFLNHGIARSEARSGAPTAHCGPSFTDRYIFPDNKFAPISTTTRVAEENGFEARDVENLREHYALTLRHWARRLEARHDEVCRLIDEATYRAWRLMCAAAWGFQTGRLNLYQSLLVKTDEGDSGLPLTREDWYA
jgi:cyclopropane-fatty-acyl-phospholipid synthase